MDQIKSIIDGFIDFEGQRLAETLTTAILVLAGTLAFIVGYVLSDLKYTVYIGLSGTVIAFLAVVPPWGIYKRNPLTYLPAGGVQVQMVDGDGDGGKEKDEGKKVK
ncbi:microsomal signal peptidase 12 kDa subunit-domain-containing protein [Tuber borchii]|uniref:Signal peptidase complex subunit 1 n=1 Tax=Tuber borchii TaxID=42251 RepID=A0A2T6ZUN2_TUBBO|nr:microsomal signal peptidase 12 kDa subunit-domain-containing protein [Tuber borchii]